MYDRSNSNDQWKIVVSNKSSSVTNIYHDSPSFIQLQEPALSSYIQHHALSNDKPQSPLSRLDRFKPKSPMIDGSKESQTIIHATKYNRSWWSGFAFIFTCCIPNCILSTCCRKKTRLVQQAWREKVIFYNSLHTFALKHI